MKNLLLKKLFAVLMCIAVITAFLPYQPLETSASDDTDTIFRDDFQKDTGKWKLIGGKREVKDGKAEHDGTNTGSQLEKSYAVVENVGSDVVITARFTPTYLPKFTSSKAETTEWRIGLIAHSTGKFLGDKKWAAILNNRENGSIKLSLLNEFILWHKDAAFNVSEGKTYVMKMMTQKTKLYASVWEEGSKEPVDWMLSSTLPELQLGHTAVGIYFANCKVSFHEFTVTKSPPIPPELKVDSVKPCNIFKEEEKPSIVIRLDNTGNTPSRDSYDINLTVRDMSGKELASEKIKLSVETEQLSKKQVTFDKIREKGAYDVAIEMKYGTKTISTKNVSFAIADDSTTADFNSKSPFAVASYGAYKGVRFNEKALSDSFCVMQSMGIKSTREELHWGEMRPEEGGVYLWEKFDTTVELARKHKINITGLIVGFPSWNWMNNNSSSEAWERTYKNIKQYAVDLAKRYKPGGDLSRLKRWKDNYGITEWEIWNEPCYYFPGTAEQYGRIVKAVSEGIKSIQPDATIMIELDNTLSKDRSFDAKAMEVAGKGSFNAVAIHIYEGPENPDFNSYEKLIREQREFIDNNGGKGMPIYLTEFGWHYGQVSKRVQAENLVRGFLLTTSSGIYKSFSFTFNYIDMGWEGGWGLVDGELNPRPAAVAYAAMTKRLGDKQYLKALDMGKDIKGFVFADKKGNYSTALYAVNGNPQLTITPEEGKPHRVYDIMGNKLGQYNKEYTIKLSESVIYVDTLGSDSFKAIQAGVLKGVDTFKVELSGLAEFTQNGAPTVTAKVINNTNSVQAGILTVEAPPGCKVNAGNVSIEELNAGESKEIVFKLSRFKKSADGKYPFSFTIKSDTSTYRCTETIFINAAQRFTPKLDGSGTEWRNQIKHQTETIDRVRYYSGWTPEEFSAESATAWDKDNFYIYINVTDNIHSASYGNVKKLDGDGVHICLDPMNTETLTDDLRFTVGLNNDRQIVISDFKEGKPTDKIKAVVKRAEGLKRTTYEIAIPWSVMGVTPESGLNFRYNFQLDQDHGRGRVGWMSLFKGTESPYDPAGWPVWTLLDKVPEAAEYK